jgi:hypothetical protein
VLGKWVAGPGFVYLGACRTLGIESEKAAERGQLVSISLAHSGTIGLRKRRNLDRLGVYAADFS